MNEDRTPIFPPESPDAEPTDANPVPLSPTERQRRTSDGASEQQWNARVLPIPPGNQTGAGAGSTVGGAGIGMISDEDDPQNRVSHEQPGVNTANPLDSSLPRDPSYHDDGEQ